MVIASWLPWPYNSQPYFTYTRGPYFGANGTLSQLQQSLSSGDQHQH